MDIDCIESCIMSHLKIMHNTTHIFGTLFAGFGKISEVIRMNDTSMLFVDASLFTCFGIILRHIARKISTSRRFGENLERIPSDLSRSRETVI
jgi:hypothetical protein